MPPKSPPVHYGIVRAQGPPASCWDPPARRRAQTPSHPTPTPPSHPGKSPRVSLGRFVGSGLPVAVVFLGVLPGDIQPVTSPPGHPGKEPPCFPWSFCRFWAFRRSGFPGRPRTVAEHTRPPAGRRASPRRLRVRTPPGLRVWSPQSRANCAAARRGPGQRRELRVTRAHFTRLSCVCVPLRAYRPRSPGAPWILLSTRVPAGQGWTRTLVQPRTRTAFESPTFLPGAALSAAPGVVLSVTSSPGSPGASGRLSLRRVPIPLAAVPAGRRAGVSVLSSRAPFCLLPS